MYTDSVLQILLVFVYLAIGLIAVTFPVHTICMSYLRIEKAQLEKDRKRKTLESKKQIAELTEKLKGEQKDSERFKEIERQIKYWKKQVRELEQRGKAISTKGAVRNPLLLLLGGLFAAIIGIVFYYYELISIAAISIVVSAAFSILSLSLLYRTISAIETAVLREARSAEFAVLFKSGSAETKIALGENALDIGITAKSDDDVTENAEVILFFPPEVEIKNVYKESVVVQQPDWHSYPNYNAVIWHDDLIESSFRGRAVTVSVGKPGKFEIPVKIAARGIYDFHTKLSIEVAEK